MPNHKSVFFKKPASGFTLMEILIAVFIFAIISVIATFILSSVFSTRQATTVRNQQLAQLQLATIILQRDLQQIVNRPVRAPNGNSIPALTATRNNLAFTRTGRINPDSIFQKSHLQRVAYRIKNHELIRIIWPRLDRVSENKPIKRVLLTQVISGHFSYLGINNSFLSSWPPGNLSELISKQSQTSQEEPLENQHIPMPRAIAVTLQLKHWGRFYLLVPITGDTL